MKTVIINASPRKNWNTAQLLREAQKGAESVGIETEYIDLYDLSFTGCRSCLACKRKGAERCKCYWKDDLSPLIDRILNADTLIIGTPIYYMEPTSQYRALMERLMYCVSSFDGEGSYYKGHINTGIIYTMNAPEAYYESMRPGLQNVEKMLELLLHGSVRTYAAFDTQQVKDYSQYSMGLFHAEAKYSRHETQFPADLEAAFQMGAELSRL